MGEGRDRKVVRCGQDSYCRSGCGWGRERALRCSFKGRGGSEREWRCLCCMRWMKDARVYVSTCVVGVGVYVSLALNGTVPYQVS